MRQGKKGGKAQPAQAGSGAEAQLEKGSGKRWVPGELPQERHKPDHKENFEHSQPIQGMPRQ